MENAMSLGESIFGKKPSQLVAALKMAKGLEP